MTLREEQIKNISKLIESADYVQNRHLLNVEQIVMLCNTEIEKRIDELLKESHKFQWDYVYALRQVKEILK